MKKELPIDPKGRAVRLKQARSEEDSFSLASSARPFWLTAGRALFGIDLRSLAVFRMGISVVLLVDLAVRATDLSAMYTDNGMFPRADILRRYAAIWNWSFHFGGGSWSYQAVLFSLAAGLAFVLFIGFETRLAAIGSWLMLISLHHRVPPILSGADILLRLLLFWGMFLPLQRAWSLDNWLKNRSDRGGEHPVQEKVFSVSSAAILLQIALMYLFSAIFKSNAVWLHGEAVAGILAHHFYASPLGAALLQFPRLLAGLTWGTFALEWIAPFLLFIPVGSANLRLVLVAALAAMHLGIGIFLEVDLFSPVALVGLALFLPSEFWNSRFFARFSPICLRLSLDADSKKGTGGGDRILFYLIQGLSALLVIYVFAINLNSLPSRPLTPLAPENWTFLATACGLGQRWGMFEAVPSNNGWYVARAKLNDGSVVDLLRHGAVVDWTKPKFPAAMYPNHRWRKIFREMAYYDELGFQAFRAPVAEFLCRSWNVLKTPEKRITEFEFIYCHETEGIRLDGAIPRIIREPLIQLDLNDPNPHGSL